MGDGFAKIYGDKLLRSTLFLEPPEARLVFLAMLAMANAEGVVDVPGLRALANVLNLEVSYVERALAILEAPDPDSRSKDHEGRRVLPLDIGWQLVNYIKYREHRSGKAEDTRKRVAKHRAKKRVEEAAKTTLYVIQATPHHRYKVGTSTNVGSRRNELQTGSADPLVVVATYPGTLQLERSVHVALKPYKIHGEWFEGEGVPDAVARYCNAVTTEADVDANAEANTPKPPGGGNGDSQPSGPSPDGGDTLLLFAQAWRKLTGRSEFKDFALGNGPPTGTEQQWLTSVRKICGGSVADFRARVSARLAEDNGKFLLKQTLMHWERGPLQAPAKAPSTPSAPTAAYHAPLEPRADEGPAVSYADAMAEQEPS